LDKENRETPDNKQHFDYYVPETKETISFKIEEACKIFPCQPYQDIPEKIDDSLDFDFEGVEEMIQNEMNKKSISNKIQKILFSVQSKEGKAFFLGTVFISGFGMIKVNINLTDMEITDFEKSSFFDLLKKVK
jgi:hypothetical protein